MDSQLSRLETLNSVECLDGRIQWSGKGPANTVRVRASVLALSAWEGYHRAHRDDPDGLSDDHACTGESLPAAGWAVSAAAGAVVERQDEPPSQAAQAGVPAVGQGCALA